jgi:hypothetical protein
MWKKDAEGQLHSKSLDAGPAADSLRKRIHDFDA